MGKKSKIRALHIYWVFQITFDLLDASKRGLLLFGMLAKSLKKIKVILGGYDIMSKKCFYEYLLSEVVKF